MKARYLSIAALLLALAVAGCGGGDDDPTTAAPVATTPEPTTLSKEDLISQGDAICAEVNAAIGTVSASATDSSSQISQEAALYGGMVERLQGLGTPDDAVGYPEFIDAADELAQTESNVELASERGEEDALLEAQESASSALSSFQSAAQAYGFEECGEGPSAPTPVTSGEEPTEESTEEPVEEEAEAAPEETEVAPETGGAGGTAESTGGGTAEGTEGGGVSGGGSGGIGPG